LPDPVLRLGVDNVPIEGDDRFSLTRDFMTMRRIGVMQEFTRAEKRGARRDRYEREAEARESEREAAIAAIQRDTAIAWLDRFYLEAMVATVRDFLHASEAEVQSADALFRAGKGAEADVFMSRGALAMARDRQDQLDRQLRGSRIALARWTGGPLDEPLSDLPDIATAPFRASELDAHLSRHPEIVSLERQAAISQAEARIAQASKHPDWTWEATYQQRGSAFGNMFSIGVSIPLPWDTGNRQDREIAAKLAMVGEATAKRDELVRAHAAEVQAMLEEWQTGVQRLRRYREEIGPLARQRTQATLAGYAGGKGLLNEVLAARRGEFDTALQALQLEQEVARIWARLAYLLPDPRTASVAAGMEGHKR
jgi:outer membrane protein TolC